MGRIKIIIECLIEGEGEASGDSISTTEERYKKYETDEFLKPIITGGDEGRIKGKWCNVVPAATG